MKTDPDHWDGDAPSTRRELAFRSRASVVFVALVFGAIAALSVVGFLFNLTINYPGSDRSVIAVDPLWMLGHIIRALGLGILAYHLWRYQSAMAVARRGSENAEQFIAVHDTAWRVGAVVLGALLVYGIVCVAFGGRSV